MSKKFYQLEYNIKRFGPEGSFEFWDGYLEPEFDNWEKMKLAFCDPIKIDLTGNTGVVIVNRINKKLRVVKAQMPAKIEFTGFGPNDKDDPVVDYPYLTDLFSSWPIMSKKMLDILLSLGDFSHQAIPTIFKLADNLIASSEERKRASLVINHNMIILQLLEHLDAIDKEKSECIIGYSKTPLGEEIETIKIDGRMVLKEPANGFPPIFRVKDNATEIYVSAAAKKALTKAEIQGVKFSAFNMESS
jgi:hypothetical protein